MNEEKRSNPRIDFEIKAFVRVVFPEQTFTPFRSDGIIENISRRGMKFETKDISAKTYKMLLGSPRNMRISFTPPGYEKKHTLFGKIVWIDFNNLEEIPVTHLGMCFEKLSEEDVEVVDYCINLAKEPKKSL
jgi:PilZ domain-containing protein